MEVSAWGSLDSASVVTQHGAVTVHSVSPSLVGWCSNIPHHGQANETSPFSIVIFTGVLVDCISTSLISDDQASWSH